MFDDIREKAKKTKLFSPDKKVVIGKGKLPCEYLFIGEAPGKTENEKGVPFCGKSGAVLDKWIKNSKISNYAITNAVFLMPIDGNGKIRKPTSDEIKEFKPWVLEVIKQAEPKVIFLVGSTACESILGKPVSECIGKENLLDNIRIFAIYHPAYYLRNGNSGEKDFDTMFSMVKKSKENLELLENIKINQQLAKDYSVKHMVSEKLGACALLCNASGIDFKDKNNSDIFLAGNKECWACNFSQSNEFDVFKSDLETKLISVSIILFYEIKGGHYNFFGIFSKESLGRKLMSVHHGTQRECKKIFLTEIDKISNEFKVFSKKTEAKKIQEQIFIPLHLHTEFSIGDGYGTTDMIAKSLKEKGIIASAITDHGTMAGNFYFQKSMKREGLKAIHGCEVYIKDTHDENSPRYHLTLLAKNETGYKNLLRLQKIAVEHFYYKPRLTYSEMLKHKEGIVCLSGCMVAKHNKLIIENKPEKAIEHLNLLKREFGKDFYVEIMPHNEIAETKKINDFCKYYARKNGVKVVCTADSHYPNKNDKIMHNAIRAISMSKKITDRMASFTGNTYYHLIDEEIVALFLMLEQPREETLEFIKNTREVFEKCDYEIKPFVDRETLPMMHKSPEDELERLVLEKFQNYEFKDKSKDRIKLELERFKEKGFTNYVLMIKKIVDMAKEKGIKVGPGRGSVGGSLVCFLLKIHDTDPIKFDLIFDRFLSEIRRDMTDIDLDFQDTRRDEVVELIMKQFGNNRAKKIITFSRFKAKGAIRDTCRIFGIPINEAERVCNVVVSRSGGDARASFTAADTFEEFEIAKEFKKKYPEATDVIVKLEGKIRHLAVHAAGIVITREDTESYVPIYKVGGEDVVAIEKRALEEMGLVKIDILGLKTLDVISELEKSTGVIFSEKNFEDPVVYEKIFSKGDTAGIFQCETTGFSKTLKQMDCRSFNRLFDANALYRPGALHSGITAEYCRRCAGKYSDAIFSHPSFEHRVKDTLGLIIYQEQVMQIVNEVGGLSWSESESLRKVMSKTQGKAMFDEMRNKFVSGAKRIHNIDEASSGKIFDAISMFGSYSFNKAHSCSYSIISYITAWYKTYYPVEFYCALLSREEVPQMEANYVSDARRHNIEVLAPNINVSGVTYKAFNGKIYCGISKIKGMGDATAKKFISSSPYKTLDDFIKTSKPSKSNFESLIFSGALDSIIKTRKWAIDNEDRILKGNFYNLRLSDFDDSGEKKIFQEKFEEYDEKEKTFKQLEYLNFPAEKHPILMYDDPFKGVVRYEKIIDLQFEDYVSERWVKGIITFINFKQEGLEGQWTMFDNVLERKYAHVNLNDESGGNVLVHFSPEQYTAYKKYFERGVGTPIIVKGSSIPNYQKIYSDAMIVMDDIDRNHPIFKYVENKREKEIEDLKKTYPKYQRNSRGNLCEVKIGVVCSVKYKVSKEKKKPYAMLFLYGAGRDEKHLCFKLDSKIFIAGEILVFLQEEGLPFIEVINRV